MSDFTLSWIRALPDRLPSATDTTNFRIIQAKLRKINARAAVNEFIVQEKLRKKDEAG